MDHINLEGVILELREAMKRITELEARVKAVEDEANARVNTVKDEANARVKTVEDEANARVKAIEDEANSRVKAIEDEANSRIKAAEKSATEANHKLQCIMDEPLKEIMDTRFADDVAINEGDIPITIEVPGSDENALKTQLFSDIKL